MLLRVVLLITALALAPAPAAWAEEGPGHVAILVLKEHGVGSAALAQPYLDRFVASAAQTNQWRSAKGQYVTNRAAAEAFIESQKSHYAILSLGAFLALKDKYHYDVIGQVAVKLAGGRRYFLISKDAVDLAGCRGKALASDHLDDERFIEKVVFGGEFKLGDFKLVQTQRPLQTITKVLSGQAVCALVDDAQLAELPHLEGAQEIHKVWKSAELPPMPVVAFPSASKSERLRFQESLPTLCHDGGEAACAEVGIVDLKATPDADYQAVINAYAK